MSKALGPLLARAAIDETETQHDAVGRLVQLLLFEKKSGPKSSAEDAAIIDARNALFGLLESSRPGVVSKACHGLTKLLRKDDPVVDISDAKGQLMKALESALAREENQRLSAKRAERNSGDILQVLTRCLTSASRIQAAWKGRDDSGRSRYDEDKATEFSTQMASLLALNRGVLYPALAHEATAILRQIRRGESRCTPHDVAYVVGPLASIILLQPEYANRRGGFLLKLSTASATASDAVKLSLIVLQAELLRFCAVYSPAHADVAAGWCDALAITALSLDSGALWNTASRVVAETTILLLAEFRERCLPLAPLLFTLQSLSEIDPLCIAHEVSFLGITALQSPCVDEREALLRLVGSAVYATSRPSVAGKTIVRPTSPTPAESDGDVKLSDVTAWSLETLVYPIVSMASAGNAAAAEVLPVLEGALIEGAACSTRGGARAGSTMSRGNDRCAWKQSLRHCSTAFIAIHHLCLLDGDDVDLVRRCEGLERRARELESAENSPDGQAVALRVDLESAFCVLAPLLLRPRTGRGPHSAACAAVVAVVRAIPPLGVRLLPFVLYAIRKLAGAGGESGAVLSLLRVLPELGRHKVAAKPVAGVIQALSRASQPTLQGVGLRLAATLIGINSRTFNQLHAALAETPVGHRPPYPAEPDETRLCRAAGMLDICVADPDQGLEFIRPLQAFLADPMPAVTALALRAIAALCRGDCLDFDAALRIISKKGKVAHMGTPMDAATAAHGYEWGDARVMAALAELCGAGAEAVAAAETDERDGEDEEASDVEGEWAMGKAVETLLRPSLRSHRDVSVRAAVYAALHAHLPALLRAESEAEAEDESSILARKLRAFLAVAMVRETGLAARANLERATAAVLSVESMNPSTWIPPKRTRGADRGGSSGGGTLARTSLSNRFLAALPGPEYVLERFRGDDSSSPGLAGAALWSCPSVSATPPSTGKDVSWSIAAKARRDEMIADLGELLAAEGAGGGGLGICPWQRAAMPLGVQRYVRRLLAACLAAEPPSERGRGEVESAAIETCRKAIEGLRAVPSALIAVALASLVSCIPPSFAHVVAEEADRAISRFRDLAGIGSAATLTGGVTNAQSVLSGDEIIPMCAAMVLRALPETAAERVLDTLQEMEAFDARTTGAKRSPLAGAEASNSATFNDALSYWSAAAVGVASEWASRIPSAQQARYVVSRAARHLLCSLAREVESFIVGAAAEAWFRVAEESDAIETPDVVVEWTDFDVSGSCGQGKAAPGIGTPATTKGSRCLALFVGLSSVLPGLRATGMHRELVQLFHIIRAFQEAGVCGAAFCLPVVVSECLSCELVKGPVVLDCLRSLSLALDGNASATLMSNTCMPAAQDVCLGAAGLVVACERKVVLPPGFAESAFDSLRKATTHQRGEDSGARVTAFMTLGSLFGCPLFAGGEYMPRRLRSPSFTTRRMLELFLDDIQEAMDTSLRVKNAALRVWGCLAALGQDERSVGNPAFSDALGWSAGYDEGGGSGVGRSAGLEYGGACAWGHVVGSIQAYALHVAREGTLMNRVLIGLQTAAEGHNISVDDENDEALAQGNSVDAVFASSSLFVRSALACLEPCARADRALRVPHAQMATVLAALFRGGHGVVVETGCVSLALALVDKDQVYSTWLRGLLLESTFRNLSRENRRHIVSVFDQLAVKLPSGTVGVVITEVWESLTCSLWGSYGTSRSFTSIERHFKASECDSIVLAAAFLSSLGTVVAGVAGVVGNISSSGAKVLDHVASVALGIILRSIVVWYADRPESLSFLDEDAPEAPLWDALVGLLSSLPPERVMDAVGFKGGVMPTAAGRNHQAIRAYLTARVTATVKRPPASSETQATSADAPVAAAVLGHVARWATHIETNRAASAAVLPRLVEGISNVGLSSAYGAESRWRAEWFRTTLDTVCLPEICPMRAFALLCGVAAEWERASRVAFLVSGDTVDILFGIRGRTVPVPEDQASTARVEDLSKQGPLPTAIAMGARFHAFTIAAPKAVVSTDGVSPGFSADVLARLFRIARTLRKRSQLTEVETVGVGPKARVDVELEEVRLGVDGFIRGLRHCSSVLDGGQSGQFAAYARSVAADRALSCAAYDGDEADV